MLAGIQLLVGSSLSVSQCPSSVGRWLAVRHDMGGVGASMVREWDRWIALALEVLTRLWW